MLSFKGLSYNLAYGLVGIFYALALASLRKAGEGPADLTQTHVFRLSFEAFPWYFLVVVALFVIYAYRRRPGRGSPD